MKHLKRLPKQFSISIPTDENSMTGRECPNPDCLGYFKIEFGTGLKGENLPCHCPYCGHTAGHDQFWTQAQIKYAESIVLNQVTKALQKDIQEWDRELRRRSRRGFLKLSVKYQGRPEPVRYYVEKELETEVVCEQCTLHFTIYGVFGNCPDCGVHNSLQILNKNLDLAEKEVELALTVSENKELAEHLIADALQNAVSTFDGFGREICLINADHASNPEKAKSISFQNLGGASGRTRQLFGFKLSDGLSPHEWDFVYRCFQKRHLLAHKMGVVDQAYVNSTNDKQAVVGRKITTDPDEVRTLVSHLRRLGTYLVVELSKVSISGIGGA